MMANRCRRGETVDAPVFGTGPVQGAGSIPVGGTIPLQGEIGMRQKAKANVKTLMEERDRLLREMDALKNKIAGLELAISLIQKGGEQATGEPRQRGTTKATLLGLLREVGTTGLTATSAVEMAARRNITLERNTAASNLSRMKADKLVVYDGDKYRLPEFARPPITVVTGGAKA
jgi:hypothetical protein